MDILTTSFSMLPFQKLCLTNDKNLPHRAEAMGTIEIERLGDNPGIVDLKSNDVVIDVGAFIGDTAETFLKKGCFVHAFEPFLDSFLCLLFNCQAGIANGRLRAYWDSVGNGEPSELVWACHGDNHGMRWVKSAPVGCKPTVKLDDLSFTRVDLIKIDCEGSEVLVLRGAKKTILKFRPKMFIEMYKDALERKGFTPDDLANTIDALGYKRTMVGYAPRWDWYCEPV